MKFKKIALSLLTLFALATSSANAAMTNWNWGGYTPSVDSPVIGGYSVIASTSTIYCTWGSACTITSYTGINAFGLIAYSDASSPVYVSSYGGSLTYRGLLQGCPANTADIQVSSPYIRSDGVVFNPYLYSYPYIGMPYANYGFSAGYSATVHLCVKSDTY